MVPPALVICVPNPGTRLSFGAVDPSCHEAFMVWVVLVGMDRNLHFFAAEIYRSTITSPKTWLPVFTSSLVRSATLAVPVADDLRVKKPAVENVLESNAPNESIPVKLSWPARVTLLLIIK